MAIITKEKDSGAPVMGEGSDGYYPYGTSLDLRDDLVAELGLDRMEPGATVQLSIVAFVQSKNSHSNEKETSTSVSLQITEINNTGGDKSRENKLYEG